MAGPREARARLAAALREAYPGCLVAVRVGDLVSLFDDDALTLIRHAGGIGIVERAAPGVARISVTLPAVLAPETWARLRGCGLGVVVVDSGGDLVEWLPPHPEGAPDDGRNDGPGG